MEIRGGDGSRSFNYEETAWESLNGKTKETIMGKIFVLSLIQKKKYHSHVATDEGSFRNKATLGDEMEISQEIKTLSMGCTEF